MDAQRQKSWLQIKNMLGKNSEVQIGIAVFLLINTHKMPPNKNNKRHMQLYLWEYAMWNIRERLKTQQQQNGRGNKWKFGKKTELSSSVIIKGEKVE